ncbi:Atxe2 family lasso peptide isopeptidase [Sphingobium sp. EM0848]|uniref:Atxe2 family lasso peptide isopeptidase n=1 Tax=Sphingobium sp. EM0848 TaxID=2743473 RepID=UPI00159CB878|nr:Atxe2 family lasso peptide isopeptidase [Sphingobium sp. EM0848]
MPINIALLLASTSAAFTQPTAQAVQPPTSTECRNLTPPTSINPKEYRRALTAADLVSLRDIGPANNELPEHSLFAISPDGRAVALQLRQAIPETNSYCLGMFVVPLRPGAIPQPVDLGGDLIRATLDGFGKSGMPSGIPLPITPQWSNDGKSILFLKRENGPTQIWLARTDGSDSHAITRTDIDIEAFRLLPNGKTLIYSTRPALARTREQINIEGRTGYHYDDRYSPVASNRPIAKDGLPSAFTALDLSSGTERPASDAERAVLETPAPRSPRGDENALMSANPPDAWLSTMGSTALIPVTRPTVRSRDGTATHCPAESCANAIGPIWKTAHKNSVRFLRREGWANSLTGIYEWNLVNNRVRRLYQTQDYLVDCQPLGDDLLCAREQSLVPRHLARIDLKRSQVELLFDPNPEFANLTLGKTERINSLNDLGLQSFEDLVYPVGYQPGRAYPTIVVQYISRGFLRGGTGDEFPIQLYSNAGYAVLSVQRPRPVGLDGSAKDQDEANAKNLVGFADRRSTLSSIEVALNELVRRGIVDRKSIGITGLSDGSSTVQFAALHSDLFAAGAVSACCWDPIQDIVFGPATTAMLHRIGWPKLIDDNPDFWSQVSLARNPRKVRFPLLFSSSDDELLSALQSYTALRQARMPVDMFVFPDEYHIKWQPSHRLAVYERSLDWFNFWLKHELPEEGRRQAEARNWEVLRDGHEKLREDQLSAMTATSNGKGG